MNLLSLLPSRLTNSLWPRVYATLVALHQLGSNLDSAKETYDVGSPPEACAIRATPSTIIDQPMRMNISLDEHNGESRATYKELSDQLDDIYIAYYTFHHLRLHFVWIT